MAEQKNPASVSEEARKAVDKRVEEEKAKKFSFETMQPAYDRDPDDVIKDKEPAPAAKAAAQAEPDEASSAPAVVPIIVPARVAPAAQAPAGGLSEEEPCR